MFNGGILDTHQVYILSTILFLISFNLFNIALDARKIFGLRSNTVSERKALNIIQNQQKLKLPLNHEERARFPLR